jgi:hypothetical protein
LWVQLLSFALELSLPLRTSGACLSTSESEGFLPYLGFDLNYPYVLDLKNPVDPHSYDGVIEVFTIRSWDKLQSEDKPISSRKVKGFISDYKEDQFGFCTPIEQKIYQNVGSFESRPYFEKADDFDRPINTKSGYFFDEPEEFMPYIEKSYSLKLEKKIDTEISNLISSLKIDDGILEKKYISSAAGYTFIDSQNGTDSITFFDQRGY